jgi:hypothetical protein
MAAKLDLLNRRFGRRRSGHADLESEGDTGDGCKHFYVLRMSVSDRTIVACFEISRAQVMVRR